MSGLNDFVNATVDVTEGVGIKQPAAGVSYEHLLDRLTALEAENTALKADNARLRERVDELEEAKPRLMNALGAALRINNGDQWSGDDHLIKETVSKFGWEEGV